MNNYIYIYVCVCLCVCVCVWWEQEKGIERVIQTDRDIAKVLDCGYEVIEFEHQSCYYILFQTNTLWKGMNPLIPAAIG